MSELVQFLQLPHFSATGLGLFRLRNVIAPVELFDVSVGLPHAGTVIDPYAACKYRSPRLAPLRHGGKDWWFCSLDCAAAFAADPDRYSLTPSAITVQ